MGTKQVFSPGSLKNPVFTVLLLRSLVKLQALALTTLQASQVNTEIAFLSFVHLHLPQFTLHTEANLILVFLHGSQELLDEQGTSSFCPS